MLTKKLLLAPLAAAVLTAGLAPTADAAKGMRYEGKTAEGTKISFNVNGPWVENISISAPTSCVSAQGSGAAARIYMYLPPFKFKLGAQNVKAKETTGITKNYTFSTKGRAGKAISGKFEVNYSMLGGGTTSDTMFILECLGTANFKVKPTR
jgi:hypothetical protein